MNKGYDSNGNITICEGNSLLCMGLPEGHVTCENCLGVGEVIVPRKEFQRMIYEWSMSGKSSRFIKEAKLKWSDNRMVECENCNGTGII
jgi:hypothetical protein